MTGSCDTRPTWWSAPAGFFLVIWTALLAGGRQQMLRDPGTLWHTVVGDRILQTGTLPREDSFSFTFAGKPWVAHQWLGECAMAVVHRAAGLDGLLLAAASLIAAVYARIGARLFASGLSWRAAAVVLALVIGASCYHFHPRPHLATIALTAWTYTVLSDVQTGCRSLRSLWPLPLVIAVWSNVHGGALGGIAMIWLVTAAWLIRPPAALRARPVVPVRTKLIALALAVGVAPLANPYGPAAPSIWLSLSSSGVLPRLIDEHAPLNPLTPEGLMVSAVGAVYLGVLAAAWRATRAAGIAQMAVRLLPLVWLAAAWMRVRHGPLFAVCAGIAVAGMLPHTSLAAWFARRGNDLVSPPRPAGGSAVKATIISTSFVLVAFLLQVGGVRCPLVGRDWARLNPQYWPVQATRVLREHLGPAPRPVSVFNDMLFGGYLIYTEPRAKLFIDDRCELYGDSFLLSYAEMLRRPERVEERLARYPIDYALLKTSSRLCRHLSASPAWRVLHRDETATLLRRSAAP